MGGDRKIAHLAGRGQRVKGSLAAMAITPPYQHLQINLLNLLKDFARSEFHWRPKHDTA
jgi:hypothetical protein